MGLTMKKNTAAAIADELDHVGHERSVVEHRAVDRERETAKVGLADDRRDDRHEEVVDERVDDRRERKPHHERNGELDDVPSEEKVLELLEHGHPPWTSDRLTAPGRLWMPAEWTARLSG